MLVICSRYAGVRGHGRSLWSSVARALVALTSAREQRYIRYSVHEWLGDPLVGP
ncbi:MAG: hypothetical protein ACI9MC_002784, partial [Kiritimatiellia bacterium]